MTNYTVEEFLSHKQALEKKQRELDRAQGRLDGALRRLQEDFNCSSEELAKKLLVKKQKAWDTLAKEQEQLYQKYVEAFGNKLGE